MPLQNVNIFWFRRDLRLHDNAGLYYALKNELPVVPVFLFDKNILDQLEEKNDKRVDFIYQALLDLQTQLISLGSSLEVYYGTPVEMFQQLCNKYNLGSVFANHDYEPYSIERDEQVREFLNERSVSFHTCKDHVIFEKEEVLKDDGKPYTIFTPYSRKWKSILNEFYLKSYPAEKYHHHFFKQLPVEIPTVQQIGFEKSSENFQQPITNDQLIKNYKEQRDIPSINGTSKLGVHLRFGTISIRVLARHAQTNSETFLNELIWRDFYQMILWHFPQVGNGRSFKPEYDFIQWRNNEDEFQKWCEGQTGYPIVDAGMRELNETGFMHNRVRMIVASFLTKHLLIDWRWGEAYFAKKLLDFDLAANNGGWQWAAGSGCDAVPYFRIFNPYLQTTKFDPQLKYIRQWVPEFEEFHYPKPIVEHEFARKRCLEVYSNALKKN